VTELLKHASNALIANDAATLERLAQEASLYTGTLRTVIATEAATRLGPAAEVLRRQVLAASVQLATRRRLSATSSLRAYPWER
jgi:hypothetical protein